MSENDFFVEIKKRELTRFQKAIKEARETVLVNRFPSFQNATVAEVKEFEGLLNELQAFVLFLTERFSEHLPSPLEEKRGRSIWEIYLSGAMHLARRFPKSFFRRMLDLDEWKDFPKIIDAYLEKCLAGFSEFMDLGREIKKYYINYRAAREILKQHFPENELTDKDFENGLGDICRLYASLKSWQKEEEFSGFQSSLQRSRAQLFEIIIEGPIQLYLVIGEDTWMLILKILTVEKISDFLSREEGKESQDLIDLHRSIYKGVKESQSYQVFKDLFREALRIYLESYLKEAKAIRRQYPTEDLQRKFIRRFESGEIFKENA